MKTNLEKWNCYLSIIEKKTNEFIDSQKEEVMTQLNYLKVTSAMANCI